MTTHEMMLLCSSLQGVGRCIPLCLVWGFATFVAFGNFGYPHLRLEACRSLPQHNKFFLGTVGACWSLVGGQGVQLCGYKVSIVFEPVQTINPGNQTANVVIV